MTKRFIRSAMIGFCVFITTIIIAYISINTAYKNTIEKTTETLSPIERNASAKESGPIPPTDITTAEYYLARYDGNKLAVYACSEDTEEFLYTIDVRIEDISNDELAQLRRGIRLDTKQALASFEEDFSS